MLMLSAELLVLHAEGLELSADLLDFTAKSIVVSGLSLVACSPPACALGCLGLKMAVAVDAGMLVGLLASLLLMVLLLTEAAGLQRKRCLQVLLRIPLGSRTLLKLLLWCWILCRLR